MLTTERVDVTMCDQCKVPWDWQYVCLVPGLAMLSSCHSLNDTNNSDISDKTLWEIRYPTWYRESNQPFHYIHILHKYACQCTILALKNSTTNKDMIQ